MIEIGKINCTVEELYNTIPQLNIFEKYIKNFEKVGKLFRSELRKDDVPSCEIKYSRNNQLYYKDYGEEDFLTPVTYVMKKFSINKIEAIRLIMKDFNKQNKDIIHKEKSFTLNLEKTNKIIHKKRREWNIKDLEYWNNYGWTKKMLEEANIEPIQFYWINGEKYTPKESVYCFNYYRSKGIFRRKLYFPERLTYRFLGNTDETIIQGWNLLPKSGGEILFITSSFKDIGPFWRVNKFCNACAPSTETMFFPQKPFKKLKERWNKIIIYFDNDKTGIKFARKFSKEYRIEYDHTPIGEPKDPSDFVKKYGLEKFNNLISKYYA